eukprot:5633609-Amphidinium_carterae.1
MLLSGTIPRPWKSHTPAWLDLVQILQHCTPLRLLQAYIDTTTGTQGDNELSRLQLTELIAKETGLPIHISPPYSHKDNAALYAQLKTISFANNLHVHYLQITMTTEFTSTRNLNNEMNHKSTKASGFAKTTWDSIAM